MRFGMRTYEDGEESLLTASMSSRAEDVSARPQDTTLGGDSLEMSFTESFLRREVDGALAGLERSGLGNDIVHAKPATPVQSSTASFAPDTIKAGKNTTEPKPASPWSSPESSDQHLSTSPLSSPTIRPQKMDSTSESQLQESGNSSKQEQEAQGNQEEVVTHTKREDAQEATETHEDNVAQVGEEKHLPEEPELSIDTRPIEASSGALDSAENLGQEDLEPVLLPEAEAGPSTSPKASNTSVSPPHSPISLAHTPSQNDTSHGSSSYNWATPRTDASGPSGKSPQSPVQWPGMYEFSYLSEKEALDDVDTGPLVPFAAQELSSKLFSIESLGAIDTRELLNMITALDRTHTERTIFLQHRLARSHRYVQLLRAQLQQSWERIQIFEHHIQEFVQRKMDWDKDDGAKWDALHALTDQLESRLVMLHRGVPARPASPPSPSPATSALPSRSMMDENRAAGIRLERERAELEETRRQLEKERRDLEIRRAEPAVSVHEQVQNAVDATRRACQQDADVRILIARQEAANAMREMQARLTEAETQPSHVEVLGNELERANERAAAFERQLHAETQAHARAQADWDAERHALQSLCAQADTQHDTLHSELVQTQRARDEMEAKLKAEINSWHQRVITLEHDVAQRELQRAQLQKQHDKLKQETHNFSLALYVHITNIQCGQGSRTEHAKAWDTGLGVLGPNYTARVTPGAACSAEQDESGAHNAGNCRHGAKGHQSSWKCITSPPPRARGIASHSRYALAPHGRRVASLVAGFVCSVSVYLGRARPAKTRFFCSVATGRDVGTAEQGAKQSKPAVFAWMWCICGSG